MLRGMWFRIELNKDRSVRSCVEVETSFKNGRSVYYIEADSKEKALQVLVRKYQERIDRSRAYANKRYADFKAMGICPGGCNEPAPEGRVFCRRCQDDAEVKRKQRVTGQRVSTARAETQKEKAAAQLRAP
jgi:hypothetical protein